MRRALLSLPLLVALTACPVEPIDPVLDDGVEVVLWTTQCEPDALPQDHFFVTNDGPYAIAWDVLCVRDRGEFLWFAVKVSYWEDRAEDAWNLWLIDPSVREVTYGERDVDGTTDPNIPNTSFPDALERVPPAPLDPGDYRVEVWGIVGEYTDSQRNEVRLTVVE